MEIVLLVLIYFPYFCYSTTVRAVWEGRHK
jgi:hypothetical protein